MFEFGRGGPYGQRRKNKYQVKTAEMSPGYYTSFPVLGVYDLLTRKYE